MKSDLYALVRQMDAEGQTIERGRDACTPYRRDMPSFFLAYACILAGAVLFIGLGGIS